MAKCFRIEFLNGDTKEYSASAYIDAKYDLAPYISSYGYDVVEEMGLKTYVKGAAVSPRDFMNACDAGFEAWFEKKSLTHKRVKVLHGSSVGCYVYKWIKK